MFNQNFKNVLTDIILVVIMTTVVINFFLLWLGGDLYDNLI